MTPKPFARHFLQALCRRIASHHTVNVGVTATLLDALGYDGLVLMLRLADLPPIAVSTDGAFIQLPPGTTMSPDQLFTIMTNPTPLTASHLPGGG